MSTERYNAVVVGVGGMGSAALYHLARRGRRVLGLERFDIPNAMGSSHGVTRIIRLAYFEHPDYVPLLRRAYELWRELESEVGEKLLHTTGIVEAGGRIYEGALRSAAEHDLRYEAIDGRELGLRHPAFRLPADLPVFFQPDGGFLPPERCIVVHAKGAEAAGAIVHTNERVLDWTELENGIRVRTERRVVETERLVLTAGAWSQDVARIPPGVAGASPQAVAWLQPLRPELFTPARMPVFNFELDGEHFYGFPEFGVPGVKLGRFEHGWRGGDPDAMSRDAAREDEAALRTFAERYLPDGAGPTVALTTCLFEPTPDEHFLVDRHPESEHAIVGAGFSGHGFKFCSVVGEILADLALEGSTRHDIDLFRLDRFTRA